LLGLSAHGTEISPYHIEAAIASIHATAGSIKETDWGKIVSLYDTLMSIRPTPIVALNRAIAIAQKEGPERGLEQIRSIAGPDRLLKYPFYSAAIGDLELRRGNHRAACEYFRQARSIARNPMERAFLDQRISACGHIDTHSARSRPKRLSTNPKRQNLPIPRHERRPCCHPRPAWGVELSMISRISGLIS
jgi:RNA polymerase sigma-70 factor (ECF subfamily)